MNLSKGHVEVFLTKIQNSEGQSSVSVMRAFKNRPCCWRRHAGCWLVHITDDWSYDVIFCQIERGMVIYVCFYKGATDDILPKIGQLPLLTFELHMCICLSTVNPQYGNILFFPLSTSLHSAEHTAVWVWFREVGVIVGASWQPADCPSGHAGRESQRQGNAVPLQHQKGGWAATLQCLRLPVWEGTGSCSSWSDSQTWDLWNHAGAEARHWWTLHPCDGFLSCRKTQNVNVSIKVTLIVNFYDWSIAIWFMHLEKTANNTNLE